MRDVEDLLDEVREHPDILSISIWTKDDVLRYVIDYIVGNDDKYDETKKHWTDIITFEDIEPWIDCGGLGGYGEGYDNIIEVLQFSHPDFSIATNDYDEALELFSKKFKKKFKRLKNLDDLLE